MLPTSALVRGSIVIVGTLVLTWLLFPVHVVIAIMHGLCLAVALGMMAQYLPPTARALIAPQRDAADRLLLGLGCIVLSVIGLQGYSWLNRYMGEPPWLQNSWAVPVFLTVRFYGFLILMLAPQVVEGRMPERGWRMAAFAVTAGAGLAVTLLALEAGWWPA